MEVLAAVFSWTVVGVVVPVVIGIGVGVLSMAPPEFGIARVCFATSALLLIAKVGSWGFSSSSSRQERVIAAVVLGLTFLAWTESWRWIAAKERRPPDSHKEQDDSRDQHGLTAKIEYLYAYNVFKGGSVSTAFFPLVTVTNNGAPTTLDGWRLRFQSTARVLTDLPYLPIPRELRLHQANTGNDIVFDGEESLAEKAMQPLVTGQRLRGWLMFMVPGEISIDKEVFAPQTTIKLSFLDSRDRRIISEPLMDLRQQPSVYFPGTQAPREEPSSANGPRFILESAQVVSPAKLTMIQPRLVAEVISYARLVIKNDPLSGGKDGTARDVTAHAVFDGPKALTVECEWDKGEPKKKAKAANIKHVAGGTSVWFDVGQRRTLTVAFKYRDHLDAFAIRPQPNVDNLEVEAPGLALPPGHYRVTIELRSGTDAVRTDFILRLQHAGIGSLLELTKP